MSEFPKRESEPLVQPPAEPPEVVHLVVEKYDDSERKAPPDWLEKDD